MALFWTCVFAVATFAAVPWLVVGFGRYVDWVVTFTKRKHR